MAISSFMIASMLNALAAQQEHSILQIQSVFITQSLLEMMVDHTSAITMRRLLI